MKKSTKILGMIILLTCSIQASANSMFLTFVMVSSLVSKLGYSVDPIALAKIVNLTAEEFIRKICKSLTEKTKSNEDKKQSTDLASLFEEPTPTDEQEAWFKALVPESYDTIRRHQLYESVFLPLFPALARRVAAQDSNSSPRNNDTPQLQEENSPEVDIPALAPPVAAQDSNSSPRNNDTPQLQEENSLAVDTSSEHSYSSQISYDDEGSVASETTGVDQLLYKGDGDKVALTNNNNPIAQASNNTRSTPLYDFNYVNSLSKNKRLAYLHSLPEADRLAYLNSLSLPAQMAIVIELSRRVK